MHCSPTPGHLLPFKFRAHKKIRTGYIVGHLGGRSKIPLVVIAYQMPSTEDLHMYTCPRNEEETSARQLTTKQVRSMILTEKWGAQHRSCLLDDELRGAKNRVANRERRIREHREAIKDCPNIGQWYPYSKDYDDETITERRHRRVEPLSRHEDYQFNNGPWAFVLCEKHHYKYRGNCEGDGSTIHWIRPMDILQDSLQLAVEEREATAALLTQSDEDITQYHLANQKG